MTPFLHFWSIFNPLCTKQISGLSNINACFEYFREKPYNADHAVEHEN